MRIFNTTIITKRPIKKLLIKKTIVEKTTVKKLLMYVLMGFASIANTATAIESTDNNIASQQGEAQTVLQSGLGNTSTFKQKDTVSPNTYTGDLASKNINSTNINNNNDKNSINNASPRLSQYESKKVDSVATSKTAILKTLAGLGVTLLIIFGFSYLAKKLGLQHMNSNKHMRVVSSLSLGQKERAVLIQVNDQTLLIGVSQGGVNLLKTIDEQTANHKGDLNIQEGDPEVLQKSAQESALKSTQKNDDQKSDIKGDIKNKEHASNNHLSNSKPFEKVFIQQEQYSSSIQNQLSIKGAANIIEFSNYIKRFIHRK